MGTSGRLTNWAGNITFSAGRIHKPASLAELQRLVAGSGCVRALGTGHSFSPIADTPGDLVSVADLPKIMTVDADRATVTVSAGVRYGELAPHLHTAGYALRHLASLPHISVAGACATGTHGSGNSNGNLATAVSAMEMITADGDVITMSREADGDRFRGAVVGLGALGIVTGLSLDIVPAFDIRQYVYEMPGPWHERLPHFRLDFTPSAGDELQSEYLMPRRFAADAMRAIVSIRDQVAPVLRISEIRTVAADDLWLSPSYQQDSVAIHFTWLNDVPAVTPVLARIEDRLAPFGARPHWAKLFTTSPAAVSRLYERLPDFRRLLRSHDPAGKFRNKLVDTYVPAGR